MAVLCRLTPSAVQPEDLVSLILGEGLFSLMGLKLVECQKPKKSKSNDIPSDSGSRQWGASHHGSVLNQWNVSDMNSAIDEYLSQKPMGGH